METGVTHTKLSKTHNVANRGKAWNGCCKEDRKQPDVKCEEGGEESVYAANSHWNFKIKFDSLKIKQVYDVVLPDVLHSFTSFSDKRGII